MAKKSQRPARQKKLSSGCMWGIISMFDFRHGRTPRRLLSDRRTYTDFNAHGPILEANFPTNYQEMHPSIKDGEKIKKLKIDVTRTRVKEVIEEKMFIDQDSKPIRKNREHMNISKTLKKSFDEEMISHQAQKTSQYHDLEALVREILLIYRKRNEQHGDFGTGAKRSFPIVEEKLIAAVEALLNEKSRNGDHKKFHHSKEMFQMLSSNKEMFLKILQDQNSILLNEDQKSRSKGLGQEELLTRKHQKSLRKNSKSLESILLYEKDKIVILKSGCSESKVQMGNVTHIDENGSRFSFMKAKRRLKHAMDNEQETSGSTERAGRMVDGGWSSPNRNHFYMERFAKITNGLKTGDRFAKSRATKIRSENADNKISNIYVEAKKHLSEMLTSGDEDAESMKRSLPALPKSLGRIMSLREFNSLSPSNSPRGQPGTMVNNSQLTVTIENPERKIAMLDDATCEGDQDIVKSPSWDKEHKRKSDVCEPRDPLTEDRPSKSLEADLPNENSLASKPEELEISLGKPSPLSILEPLFSDDDITPARTVSLPVEAAVQPRCIEFDKVFSGVENQQIRITDSGDNEESAFEYVEAVLLSSDLNWSEFENRWMSSVQILDPSLFDEVETFSSRAKYDQKLLFDSLVKLLKTYAIVAFPNHRLLNEMFGPFLKEWT